MAFGLPQVTLTFTNAVQTAANEVAAGRLAMAIRDAGVSAPAVMNFTNKDEAIGAMSWTAESRFAIEQAFMGHPSRLILVALPAEGDLATAYTMLESLRFDVCTVAGLLTGEAAAFITWAKAAYDTKRRHALYVTVSEAAPDHKAVINFVTNGIIVDSNSYSALEYLPRIAGAIAGLQLWESSTYLVLPEVKDCPHLTRAEADAAIAAGKLILYHDGEKVKIARGVTSLTTLPDGVGTDFQKIKVLRIINQIEDDIVRTIEDNYIGRVANTYVTKCLLVSAINDYLLGLERLNVLVEGKNTVAINVVKNRTYLKTQIPEEIVDAMDDDAAREAYTDDKLFLRGTVRPADSLEDITIDFTL